MMWLFVALAALGLAACDAHGEDAHSHGGHEHHASSGATLRLNDGAKWPTDAPLRAGMTRIRDQVQAALPAVHDASYTPAQYAALARSIEGEVRTIMESCRLPADADAQLHIVLAQLFAGTEAMKGDGDRMAGVVKVIEALASYGEFFDHPGFRPVTH